MAIASYFILWGPNDAAAAEALNIQGYSVTPRAVDGLNPGGVINIHEVDNWYNGQALMLNGMYLVPRSVIDQAGFAENNPSLYEFLLTKPWGMIDESVAFLVP